MIKIIEKICGPVAGPSAVKLLDSLSTQLRLKLKHQEQLSFLPSSPNHIPGGGAPPLLSILNLAAKPGTTTPDNRPDWAENLPILVSAARIVAAGESSPGNNVLTDLEAVANDEAQPDERQSLAVFLLAVTHRRRGSRAEFASWLGRLLQRQRRHPETLTVQAS